MRLISIVIAAVVATGLYFWVIERETLMQAVGVEAPPGDEAVAGEAAPDGDADAEAPAGVPVVAVASEARRIDSGVRLRGQTEAQRQVEVRAETTGRIVSEPVRRGAFVAAGDLLCELDPGTRQIQLLETEARRGGAQARVPEAKSRVAEARARLEEVRIEQNAATRLSEGGFAAQTRVASAEAAVESALAAIEAANSGVETVTAGIQAAEAAVAAAETELDRLRIEAPFDGVLESDTAELGALLQPGSPCATVFQLDPIKLVGFVPETEVSQVELGARAGARLASGQTATGEVTFLSRSADPDTRTFRVEAEVPNPELSIREGQTVEMLIASDGRDAHLLPQSAMTLDDAGDLGVRVIADDGTALFRPVDIVRDAPEGVYVTGLDQTANVIVVGQEYVTDGVAVRPTYRDGDAGATNGEPTQ